MVQVKYPKLFEKGYIGKLELKNRIVRAPMLTDFANPDGSVNYRLVQHYKELARGGAALVIVEYTYIDEKASKSAPGQLAISRNDHIPGLAWLSDVIKENGARSCLQIVHAGSQKFLREPPIKAPSRVPWEELYRMGIPPPEELTYEEIQEIIEAFGDAALRAKMAGFDMVEVHGAHGYLIT
ncbi:NADH oxidase, partial [Candidatus Bathyarchaeota archaeon]